MTHLVWRSLLALPLLGAVHWAQAMGDDDPLLGMFRLDKLEFAVDESPTPQRLEAEGWLGYDLNKAWLEIDAERHGSEWEAAQVELLYGRAFAPYWDFQAGWKRDIEPESRDWLAVGVQGLAPYFFEVDATFYIGESADTAFAFSAEYELLLAQKLVLSPELEFDLSGYDNPEAGIGRGLSELALGLRLRYEFRREIAPYIGLHWERAYGGTADYLRSHGEDVQDTQLVLGIRAWF